MDLHASMEQLRTALGTVAPMSNMAWKAAVPQFFPRQLGKGEHAVEAGQQVGTLLFMISGVARYYYLDERGREFNKSFSGAGQVLSSISSLVDGDGSPFSIQALTLCHCLGMNYQDFLALAARWVDWERLRVRLLERLVIKKERREADFLRLSPTERYQKFREEFAGVGDTIPNYHIASYLGITEVGLSRIRRRLGLTEVNVTRSR